MTLDNQRPTRISFVRHGMVHNPGNVVYGRLPDFPLSVEGQLQAARAAEYMSAYDLAAVFSSPLLRAQQTAQALLAYHPGVPLVTSELINEVHTWFEGRSTREVEARGWDMYTGIGAPYEQPDALVERVAGFIAQVRRDYAGQHVAAVSHGDIIAFMVLWARAAPITPENKNALKPFGIPDGYPATASIITLTFHTAAADERPELSYVRPYGDELHIPQLGPGHTTRLEGP